MIIFGLSLLAGVIVYMAWLCFVKDQTIKAQNELIDALTDSRDLWKSKAEKPYDV